MFCGFCSVLMAMVVAVAGFNYDSSHANIIVAKDGTGRYSTVNEALHDVPYENSAAFVVYVKAGIYKEYVLINSSITNLILIGDGPLHTKITGNKNADNGIGTIDTATVSVYGTGFVAKDIGFENSAGAAKHQAVALMVEADRSIFYNCQIDGYQDTLYTRSWRQFYRDCTISGTIDFIFGDSQAIFQNCKIVLRKPILQGQVNVVTAQGRERKNILTAIVLQNCTITADPLLVPVKDKIMSYLGRPWKQYSTTIIMQTQMDDVISPAGWLPWNGDFAFTTCFYAEYNNRGVGAKLSRRVKWPCIKTPLTTEQAMKFTVSKFLGGDRWIAPIGVPYTSGI